MKNLINIKKLADFLRSGSVAVIAMLMLAVGSVSAQSDGSQQNKTGRAGTFAITNARIVTVSGEVIEKGSVLIRDGKIAAVGTSIQIPRGAETIKGDGMTVFPGMIDAATNLGLAEISGGANATMDVQEVGSINANARAIKGVNPHSSHVNVTRINGITTVISFPTGGLISGQAALINLNGSTQDEMAVVPEAGLIVNFPRVATGRRFGFGGPGAGGGTDFNAALRRRDEQLDELKKLFEAAKNYQKARAAYESDKSLPYLATDAQYEALVPYVTGQKPIFFTAEREIDIKGVAKFVADMKLKGIIIGGQEAWKAADDLKKNNIAVIFTNIYSLPTSQDYPYDYYFAAPGKMQSAGIKFAVSTGEGGGEVRDLPYQAGIAGAFGLTPEQALRSVTLNPAEILGVADKLGSIEVGKIANVVVADGDILDPRTKIQHMFIGGRLIPLTSRHTELFDSFKNRTASPK
ncbi:MAG: amidohydrolase family protein [Acidobacteria bacterium]|nr:amidohydrolase family protein [Acidobacteriota bacterium]